MQSSQRISNVPKPQAIAQYSFGQTIGQGTFGKVKLGIHGPTGEKVAIKILEKTRIKDSGDVERISREIKILKAVRHPNVIQLFEIIESQRHLYLVTEYATGGELFQQIVSSKRLTETTACEYLLQILSGIEYLHKVGIVHRDLKPENVLLDHQQRVKLVDFGLSNLYVQGSSLKTACGSPCYAAPEMIAGKRYKPLKADIWSWGIILYAMVCGTLPFEDKHTKALYKKILAGDFKIPNYLSIDIRDLLRGILTTNPENRLSIDEIRAHRWWKRAEQFQTQNPPGIIVGTQKIPIEQRIVDEVPVEKEKLLQNLANNKHNAQTAMYYLLLLKFIREGGSTTADLATWFEPVPAVEVIPKPQPPSQKRPDLNRTMPAEMNETNPRLRRFIDYSRRNESVDHGGREVKSQSRACTREYVEYSRRNESIDERRKQAASVSRAPTRENVILTKYRPREMPSRISTQSTSPTPRIQNRRIIINAPVAKPGALISPMRTRKVATRAGHRMMTPAGRAQQENNAIYIGNGN